MTRDLDKICLMYIKYRIIIEARTDVLFGFTIIVDNIVRLMFSRSLQPNSYHSDETPFTFEWDRTYIIFGLMSHT